MAGKKLFMGAILSDLADKMASMSADMVTVANRLEAVALNTSQSVVSVSIASETGAEKLSVVAPLAQEQYVVTNGSGANGTYTYKEGASLLSSAAGTLAVKVTGATIYNNPTFSCALNWRLVVKVAGVAVYTGGITNVSSGATGTISPDAVPNITVAAGQTISVGIEERGNTANVTSGYTLTFPVGSVELSYKLVDKISDGAFTPTV